MDNEKLQEKLNAYINGLEGEATLHRLFEAVVVLGKAELGEGREKEDEEEEDEDELTPAREERLKASLNQLNNGL